MTTNHTPGPWKINDRGDYIIGPDNEAITFIESAANTKEHQANTRRNKMTKLYVYSLEDNSHVATITGNDNAACEAKANDVYGSNDYGWTYSPAFGATSGLTENGDKYFVTRKTEQLIWTGDCYDIADDSNSEEPEWPVQDEGGRWHYEQFSGQRVCYDRGSVWFGFRAIELSRSEVEAMNVEDIMAEDVYTSRQGLYRVINCAAYDRMQNEGIKMETVSVPDRLEIDIRRPDGSIETVTHPTLKQISPRVFEQMRAATRAAGRGDCLAYREISKEVAAPQPSAADLADEKYRRDTAAIYRASAGGEPCDDGEFVDNTPAHKSDF